jgi:inner membrane protein
MDTPPALPPPALPVTTARRNATTLKLLVIAALIVVLQFPLYFIGQLQQERLANIISGRRAWAESKSELTARGTGPAVTDTATAPAAATTTPTRLAESTFEPYRMVVRSLKYNVLVMVLVFAAFFLFETLGNLRLHAIHYGLVGAAMCLFYLALLALGEVTEPAIAYTLAALASSVLITFYSAAILRGRGRAAAIGVLLTCVHSVLYVVLRMENFALLAGTATLFAALAAVMYFTRNVDWHGNDAGKGAVA